MGYVQHYNFIPENETDPDYDYDYTNLTDTGFSRGGYTFNRPNGWLKIALKIENKYLDGNDWYGAGNTDRTNSIGGEWPVSFHGTKDHNTITRTIQRGYDMTLATRSQYGVGIYSSPFPEDAEYYAEEFVWKGKKIKAMFMNRIHMSYTNVVKNGRYFVTTNDRMIRPIAVLIKEV